MNQKNRFFIIGLILLVLFTLSVVSASENVTVPVSKEVSDAEDVLQHEESNLVSVNSVNKYKAKLVAKDVNEHYDPYSNQIKVLLKDNNGKPLEEKNVKVIWDGKFSDIPYEEKNGEYYFDAAIRGAGNHKVKIILDDPTYSAKPIFIKVKLTKTPVKMVAKTWMSTTKSITVLKAVVKDKYGEELEEGAVKFSINGKSYKAKIKDCVAIKKIKLKKAKNYKYKVTLVSKTYNAKPVFSKVFVKKAKKHYTIKTGKYKIQLSYKQYLKLIKAKNNHEYAHISKKTGLNYYYKVPAYKTVKVTKTKWVHKKVLSYESFYYDDGTVDSYSYSLTKYYKNGWKWYGSYSKSYSNGYESYAKFKKKVKYTVTKKVRNGFKTAKSPIYVNIELLPKDALIKKGDYIRAWTAGGGDLGTILSSSKINFYKYSP